MLVKFLTAMPASSSSAVLGLGILIPIVLLLLFLGLGAIPANIAYKKGYSFGLYWLFGFFLFFPALIVSLCISDKNAPQQYFQPPVPVSAADELKKYSELHDQGAITDEEFQKIKSELLNKLSRQP